MNAWICNLIVLAQDSRYHSLGSRFRGRRARMESSDLLTVVVFFAVIAVGVFVLSRVVRRFEGRRRYNSPRRLFRELCSAHGLQRKQRRLLVSVAAARGLASPAHLFLQPDLFEVRETDLHLHSHRAAIQHLRDRLFGETVDAAEA